MVSDFGRDVRVFLAKEPFCLRDVPEDILALYCTALTHDSYSNERKDAHPPEHVESYERLEFFGDSVLEFIVCEYIYKNSDEVEGNMTTFKIDKVDNERLSDRILSYPMNIDDNMRVGGGHIDPHTKKPIIEPNMRADSFEALLAASYLGYGMDYARGIVEKVILGR